MTIQFRLLASDDEFSLFSVVIFRRVHDDFTQKCREQKYLTSFLFDFGISCYNLFFTGSLYEILFIQKKRSRSKRTIFRWPTRRKRNYGYCREFPEAFCVAHRILDRATKTGSHKFLRIIPDSAASQSHPTIRRKCFAIRTARRIHWDRCGSKLVCIVFQ